jgi:hypothetical protein
MRTALFGLLMLGLAGCGPAKEELAFQNVAMDVLNNAIAQLKRFDRGDSVSESTAQVMRSDIAKIPNVAHIKRLHDLRQDLDSFPPAMERLSDANKRGDIAEAKAEANALRKKCINLAAAMSVTTDLVADTLKPH